jgi:hypothetical protein
MEKAPLAAREEALNLIDDCLDRIARGEDMAQAFDDIALYARLAASNERWVARQAQLTPANPA